MELAGELERIEPRVGTSPWPGHEHVRGYAVMALPFSSGHVLGLRVWPENDFAPYVPVWYRTPGGDWSIFNDGPLLEATCPRYWGPAVCDARLVRIHLSWTGPNELRVEMEDPALIWAISMAAPSFLWAMNAVSGSVPLWSWKPFPLSPDAAVDGQTAAGHARHPPLVRGTVPSSERRCKGGHWVFVAWE